MKKLKLKAFNLNAKEMLTREQLRNVIGEAGTSTGGGGGAAGCGGGPCTLAVANPTGTGYTTYTGTCAGTATWVGSVLANYSCYCNALGAPIPLSSNGGVSRCGSGGTA